MEDSPPYGTVRPIRSSAAALGWALTTLRSIADALEATRPKEHSATQPVRDARGELGHLNIVAYRHPTR